MKGVPSITQDLPTSPRQIGRTAWGAVLLMIAFIISTFVMAFGARVLGLPDIRVRVGVSLTFFAFVFIALVAYDNLKKRWGKVDVNSALILLVLAVVLVTALGAGTRIRSGETDAELAMGLELIYDDGSTRIIDATKDTGFLSFLRGPTPLTILDDTGKPLSEINFVAKVKVEYTGTFHAGSIRGKITTQVNDATKDTQDFSISPSMTSGAWIRVITGGYTKYALESWGKTGQNTLRVVCQCTVEVIFDDGTTDSKQGTGGVVLTYQKASDSGITAVDATVSPTLLY